MDGSQPLSTAASLRLLADWYEAHPETEFTDEITVSGFVGPEGDAARRIARALGGFDKITTDDFFKITKKFGGITLRFLFWRHQVCSPRVVKTETVRVKKPDPSAPMIEVEEEREIIEWDCPSLLASEAEGAA